MTAVIEIKPILPKKFNSKILVKVLQEAARQEIKGVRRELNKYTATWEHKPKWDKKIRRRGSDYTVSLGTTDKRFIWVEKGTKLRYRKMSPDFQAKSVPGSLKARRGRGRATGFYRTPRPGIKARNNLQTLVDKRIKLYPRTIAVRIESASKLVFV